VEHVEAAVFLNLAQWLKLAVEIAGVLIIAAGSLVAVVEIVRGLVRRQAGRYLAIRLSMARFLSVGLEFQLAADIIGTAIAPSWEEIGKLAAIATIRTALNFFLAREIKEEETDIARGEPVAAEAALASS
jgi:uncharacterized membrane protein